MIKIQYIPPIEPKAFEKIFNAKGELTGLVTCKWITKEQLSKLYPPTNSESNQ